MIIVASGLIAVLSSQYSTNLLDKIALLTSGFTGYAEPIWKVVEIFGFDAVGLEDLFSFKLRINTLLSGVIIFRLELKLRKAISNE